MALESGDPAARTGTVVLGAATFTRDAAGASTRQAVEYALTQRTGRADCLADPAPGVVAQSDRISPGASPDATDKPGRPDVPAGIGGP